jgi:hypothetical protein
MGTCKVCGIRENIEQAHIIPQCLSRKRFSRHGIRDGTDQLEKLKAQEIIPLCRRHHEELDKRQKCLLGHVRVAASSECCQFPCHYELYCEMLVRNEQNCFTCQFLKQMDLLTLYDWFAQDYGLPRLQVGKFQMDFDLLTVMTDSNRDIKIELYPISFYLDDSILKWAHS